MNMSDAPQHCCGCVILVAHLSKVRLGYVRIGMVYYIWGRKEGYMHVCILYF